jgi:hypothetical protein
MKKEYKITGWSLLKGCGMNILLMLFALCLLYSSHKSDPDMPEAVNISKWISVMYTLIMLALPGYPLIICLNHYLHDKNTVLTIDIGSNEFVYQNGAFSITEKIENIHLVKIYRFPKTRRIVFVHYFELFLSNNTPIIVSSLLESSWLKQLNNARIIEDTDSNMFI